MHRVTAASVVVAPAPDFGHLLRMTDERGTFEHARFTEPRREHGYCTDDMARVLVVAVREPHPAPELVDLAALALRFLHDATMDDGTVRNRMNRSGGWDDRSGVDDCWGRCVWGLGTAVGSGPTIRLRSTALAVFERAALPRSPWSRATAFAALGAAEVLHAIPGHPGALALLGDAADGFAGPSTDAAWPWPEARLTYANAVLPEAMIAAGVALDRPALRRDGLALLAWLLEHESVAGHLSVTPAGGDGPGDPRPAFDQQPIEVATIADAGARAAQADDDPRWRDAVLDAAGWFLGANDGAVLMWDPRTGGGYDGLEVGRANQNMGAESTLALLSTWQHARRLAVAAS
jgi:hypothetical protein